MKTIAKYSSIFTLAAGLCSAQQYVFVDLNASSAGVEAANGLANGRQGGSASIPNTPSASALHAYVWSGTGASAMDVNPQGWYSSQILAVATGQSVGYGLPVPVADVSAGAHALVWLDGGSFIDLNPASWGDSRAMCSTGVFQGGVGLPPAKGGKGGGKTAVALHHALLWQGSAAGYIDMQPSFVQDSRIYGCADTRQVGDGTPLGAQIGTTHALIWSGTPGSAVDLHPAGFLLSTAFGISGNQQVGSGIGITFPRHALIWSGTAASATDIHPAGYQVSTAFSTNGTQQVGEALDSNSRWHAVLWSGSADTLVDLNAFLPADYTDAHARAIDPAGNIVGFANTMTGQHAVMWVRVQ